MLTIRRFSEMAKARQGLTRYVSVALVPLVVSVLVPGPWWLLCAGCAVLGMIFDRGFNLLFFRISQGLEEFEDRALRALLVRHIACLALITSTYALPYALLALAPAPGPMVGLLFCAGALVVAASLHVMTPMVIFCTTPVVLIGLLATSYAAAGGGWPGAAFALLALIVAANGLSVARSGAHSFNLLINARHRAEEAANDLERRVEERTAELALATKRAQAANRAKSAFIANMSHELRTPLNAVLGYAEIVEEDVIAGDTANCVQDLHHIKRAGRHLLALINDVLDLSRIEAGKLEIKPIHFALEPLLREAIETIRPLAQANDCELRLVVENGSQSLVADQVRLKQCLVNLLSNAAKFTKGGVITVEAAASSGAAPGLAISVSDTGRGIAPEDLERLFHPFVQVEDSNTRAQDGAGLGLAITRRLARAMGGDVSVESEVGMGSTFTITLPLEPAAQAVAA